jgi:F-type H+-transporting ATPase subunit gamma
MASSTRLIRRRIKSVTNTRKITKAMELVAAAKMRKAVASVLATRPYAEAAWRAIRELAKVTDPTLHPLLREREGTGRTLVVLYSSDRGLCGGFNAQLLRAFGKFLAGRTAPVDLVTIGRKGQDAARRRGLNVIATFTDMANNPVVTDIRPIADISIGDFIKKGGYDEVYLAYTDYRSAMTQVPGVKRLLPLTQIEGLGDVSEAVAEGLAAKEARDSGGANEYVFEPSPEKVLDVMLPRLVEAQIYQALLESSASEHAARMMAMRSATDAAEEMIGDLTLTYNQARQAGITREIAEISSGKAALEK